MSEVRVRMAPSPTGNLHLGTAYATLWPYLFARKNKGTFILRIEDTDLDRSKKEFEENIVEGLKWLGLTWDEGPYHQMERLEIYQKMADQLIDEGKAYYCFCTKEELEAEKKLQIAEKLPQVYSGKCRNITKHEAIERIKRGDGFVVRYKIPENRGMVEYEDIIHGKISFDSKLIGDFVIQRQTGVPLYNFAVVVDDTEMGITHVIRGDDHISNTPKQILLFEALGADLPQFAHYPMILNQDRIGKLSKRTSSTAVSDYKKEGYLPEALVNYLALLGWTPKDGKEILSKEEIINLFDIKDMNHSAAAWSEQKLDWINGEYIRTLSDEQLTNLLQENLVDHPAKDKIAPLVPLIKDRIKKLSDFIPLTDFFWLKQEYDKEIFAKLKLPNIVKDLEETKHKFEIMERPWKKEAFEETFKELAKTLDISFTQMFQLIRVSISGQLVTPPLFESIQILGEGETLKRISEAFEFIKTNFEADLPAH